MIINGKNYLLCEKRGCEFLAGDPIRDRSDMENYRVFIRVRTPDNVEVFGDLLRTNVYDYTKKTPRLLYDCGLGADLQSGMFRFMPHADPREYKYTQADVMRFVGTISGEKYDGIKWVHRFEVTRPKGSNFTGRQLVRDYATKHHLETKDCVSSLCVRIYTGLYKFLCYEITPIDEQHERIAVTLEAAQ